MESFQVWIEGKGEAEVQADLITFAQWPDFRFLLHYVDPLGAWRLSEASSGCAVITGEEKQKRRPFLKDAEYFIHQRGVPEMTRRVSLAIQKHGYVLNQGIL